MKKLCAYSDQLSSPGRGVDGRVETHRGLSSIVETQEQQFLLSFVSVELFQAVEQFHIAYGVLVHQAKVGKDIPDCNRHHQRLSPFRGRDLSRQLVTYTSRRATCCWLLAIRWLLYIWGRCNSPGVGVDEMTTIIAD